VREVPFAQLADRIGPRTRLVAFSLVQSHSGLTADQASIMDAARRVGARTLIDATHAVPFVSVDPRADFVVCAAYKHLLCPRGVAFMVASRDQWDHTPPLLSNWRSSSNPYGVYYGGPLNLAPNAARFDVSLAWFPWLGAAVSLSLLVDWQIAGLLEEPVRLARRLARHLSLEEPCGTVLSVAVDEAEVVRANLAQAGIKAAVRAGSVRVSPHVYNTTEDVDKAAAALSRFVRVAAA
jgi:selenocysteine lyase/cysteine desulfurase